MTRLELDTSIYSFSNINIAVNDYKDYANISIIRDGETAVIIFDDCKYDEETTRLEFENYVIGLENS